MRINDVMLQGGFMHGFIGGFMLVLSFFGYAQGEGCDRKITTLKNECVNLQQQRERYYMLKEVSWIYYDYYQSDLWYDVYKYNRNIYNHFKSEHDDRVNKIAYLNRCSSTYKTASICVGTYGAYLVFKHIIKGVQYKNNKIVYIKKFDFPPKKKNK